MHPGLLHQNHRKAARYLKLLLPVARCRPFHASSCQTQSLQEALAALEARRITMHHSAKNLLTVVVRHHPGREALRSSSGSVFIESCREVSEQSRLHKSSLFSGLSLSLSTDYGPRPLPAHPAGTIGQSSMRSHEDLRPTDIQREREREERMNE